MLCCFARWISLVEAPETTVEASFLPVEVPLIAVEATDMPVEAMDHLEHSTGQIESRIWSFVYKKMPQRIKNNKVSDYKKGVKLITPGFVYDDVNKYGKKIRP